MFSYSLSTNKNESFTDLGSMSAAGKEPNGTPEVDMLDVNKENNTQKCEDGLSYAISGSCYYVSGRIDTYRGKFLIHTGSSISEVAMNVLEYLNQKIDIEPTVRKVRSATDGFIGH